MKIRRAVVILKESVLSKLSKDDRLATRKIRDLVAANNESVKQIRPAHEEHVASVVAVRKALRERKIDFVERNKVPARPLTKYDLVISVGGDGMMMSTSHAVRDNTVILGVNSAPSFSVGFLTGCRASNFGNTLDALRSGAVEPIKVRRLQVRIGRKTLREPVLNDVLFCADNPAIMTRYRLTWPDGEEMQRSSGVWVSTPAGSSSALRSAGGPVLPLSAKQFAFLVREPYAPPGEGVRVPIAVLESDQKLTIECRTAAATVFLDGSHKRHPVPFGESVVFSLHPTPLRLVRGEDH